jgi:signal transduction histidine kinase
VTAAGEDAAAPGAAVSASAPAAAAPASASASLPAPSLAPARARALVLAVPAVLALVGLPLLLEQAAVPPAHLRVFEAAAGETVDDERLRATALPHLWREGCPDCSTQWYRIDRALAELPREALAVYLPRVADNAALYLNGRLLGQGGRFADPVARLGARPLWVQAPAALWQPGENRLYLLLKAERARFGLMPAPAIGAESELLGAWRLRQALAVTLPQVAATAAAMLALMMGVLAWYRRNEPAHLALALAAALYAADTFAGLVVEPPLAGPAWDAVRLLLHLGLAGCVGALAWRLAGVHVAAESEAAAPSWRRPRTPGMAALGLGLAIGTAALAAAAAAALQRSGAGIEAVGGFVQLAFAAAGGALFVRMRQRLPRPGASPGTPAGFPTGDEAGAAGAAAAAGATGSATGAAVGAALAVAALVDLLRLPPLALPVLAGPFGAPAAVATAAEALPLAPWALAALLGVAAWTLLVRFVETLNAAELLNIDLEALVRERTVALEAQFARVRELERREAIAAERERLMRDMHDGVGGHLVSMLAMIEADSPRRPAELAQVVREALDDMRLMIDSLEPVDDDLNAVLAMFHDRLAPRLRAAGVALHWNVELLPQVNGLTGGLTPARVLHLLRMLQEAVTNALRHGRARTLWIGAEAQPAGGGVRIEVRDDGAGFDPQAVQATGGGRGLKNLARRAREIGAELAITSEPGAGARVVVAWSSGPAGASSAA